MSPLDHATDLAKDLVNNWKRFDSYMRWERLPDGFAIVYTSNRDSCARDRSNARVIAKTLEPYTDGDVRCSAESSSHWAVGHVDGFAIRVYQPDGVTLTEAFLAYSELVTSLADYPVLDDEDCSTEEQEEANATWSDCYRPAERIEYMRDHRSQFDCLYKPANETEQRATERWRDLLAQVRGEYFAGYASEMCGS